MAKKAYIGVGGKARKVKKMYVGAGGVARRIKKAYIGVGGVARPCFFEGLEYYGTATPLSVAREDLAATTVGNYALFGGGYKSSTARYNTVDAHNTSLTRTIPTALSAARDCLAAATVGDYAMFAGGYPRNGEYTDTVDAYSASLTRTTANGLRNRRANLAVTTVGNYALFGGGNSGAYLSSRHYGRQLCSVRGWTRWQLLLRHRRCL